MVLLVIVDCCLGLPEDTYYLCPHFLTLYHVDFNAMSPHLLGYQLLDVLVETLDVRTSFLKMV